MGRIRRSCRSASCAERFWLDAARAWLDRQRQRVGQCRVPPLGSALRSPPPGKLSASRRIVTGAANTWPSRCRRMAILPDQRIAVCNIGKDDLMKCRVLIASATIAILAMPLAAHAQGVPGGVAHGVYEGNRRAGPVGAVVGGAVGGVIGGVEGVLGVDRRYDNRQYDTYYSERPQPTYRQRRVVRSKIKRSRGVQRYRSSQR